MTLLLIILAVVVAAVAIGFARATHPSANVRQAEGDTGGDGAAARAGGRRQEEPAPRHGGCC